MRITKQVLERAREGARSLEATGKSVYFGWINDLRDRQENHFDFLVEKGNGYYCGYRSDEYVYWDGQCYGFTFTKDLFDTEPVIPVKGE